ncbi:MULTISPECIES: CRISPR-associated endonuclease Cas1 [Cyanophyceae]|uniref:CRISPR-associated endonuclease Cas1 n=1 Tax=Cyanophyceae TaxID=3028117 RepID=UPI00016DCED2|nr:MULTISPECIES: CRISPR-associated endonuclease Cas1 [Cyanophyceae]ACB00985.1 CRISPR-associated protein Cas1 [Picosynechococcus sp. PCC 7002]SMH58437.1 CRISP-associated protein Cas1 [Picosynechococcus sp. OG1]SMQ86432.1 CRISP-associated protein Cas1 [Synechococcus sp. 7002]
MRTLYVSEQGCYVRLRQEYLTVWRKQDCLTEIQLPQLEQVLIFGKSQLSTQAIRACLWRDIPIVFLSRMGFCYGRIMALERGYRHLSRYQQALAPVDKLTVARAIAGAKLQNSRVILQRQQRKRPLEPVAFAIETLGYLRHQISMANSVERIMGLEGAAAASYFNALGYCLRNEAFPFIGRSRRPPLNPVNALLSFGYQVLWNHLFTLIEIRGLDPYQGCLHQGSERHGALVSDLIEEFRAPLVDSLVLYLVNKNIIKPEHFIYRDGGCFLNQGGRKVYLSAFVQQMETTISLEDRQEPRWHLLTRQVRAFQNFVYRPVLGYAPYEIR